MRVIVYCDRASTGARDLAVALRAAGVETVRAANMFRARRTDLIVAWGAALAMEVLPGFRVLNHSPLKDKLAELMALQAAGVRVPEFRPELDVPETCACPCGQALHQRVMVVPGVWLGRKRVHQSASDLRRPGTFTPEFYVKKLDVIEEFRVHVFKGKSIRTGKKMAHPDAHPWIRSGESGWWIDYGKAWRGAVSVVNMASLRDAAKAAVAALGLDFGAVDVGRTIDGHIVVFEVNTAPSLSTPNTAAAYAKAIKEYINALA